VLLTPHELYTVSPCARDVARWTRRKWLVCSRCHATMGSREIKEGGAAMRVTVTIVANGISRAHIVRDAIDMRRSIARMHTESRKRIIIYACKRRNIPVTGAMTVTSRLVPRDPRLNGSFHKSH